jgi:ribonuclease J
MVIIVSGNRDKPFSALNRIASGYDKFIKVNEKDTVVIASPAVPGTERIAARVNDEFHKTGANVVVLKRKRYFSHHASQEDLMLLMNLLMPKNIIPVKGEYRHLVAHKNAAIQAGFNEDHVHIIENGQVLEFKNGKRTQNVEKVQVGNILIDGVNVGVVGDVVLKDREILAEDGIVIISVSLDKQTKKVVAGPEVLTRGFIYVKDNTHIIEHLQELSEDVIVKNVINKRYDFNKIKQDMRSRLTQYLFEETKRRPMIITMIQEV